jgi:sensor histidine kinase YesM
VFLVLGLFIAKKFPRKYESFNWSELYLVSYQILSIVLHTVTVHYTSSILSFIENIVMLFLYIALLASSVFIFFIFDSALHKRELEKQIEIYQYQFEQIKESQTIIGRIEHDIEKHLLALKLDLKNAQPREAEQKIDALIGTLRLAENVAESGNADMDAILNYKAMQASAFGIRMTCDLRLPYTLSINTTDLAVILGNALDNAIEACKTAKPSKREISVAIKYDKHNLSMTITNPFAGEIKTDAAGELITTKSKGRHGIGLRSIQETAEKYNGLMDITAENNLFTLKILLFNLSSQ